MVKKIIIIILILIPIMAGCGENNEKVESFDEIAKNVKVISVEPTEHVNYEKYVGAVMSSGILKMSFEVSGKIIKLTVKAGDYVSEGDILVSVDTENLKYALDAANAEYKASKSQYSKANESLNFSKNLYESTLKLFNEGVKSQYELDKALLNYNIAQEDLVSASGLKSKAYTDVLSKSHMLELADLYADKSGIVVDVLVEEGELVTAGYPVVIIRDEFSVMSFGISQKDLKFIEVGKSVDTFLDDIKLSGVIESVNQIPDATTQTYEVKIKLDDRDVPLGSICSVYIPTDKIKGVLIPLGSIRSDGQDYVFIIEDGIAARANITVLEVVNQMVIVDGINKKVLLVVDGIMSLQDGDKVKVIEE